MNRREFLTRTSLAAGALALPRLGAAAPAVPLGKAEFIRILTEPRNALIKQQIALLATELVSLDFSMDSIEEIAGIAESVNERTDFFRDYFLQPIRNNIKV